MVPRLPLSRKFNTLSFQCIHILLLSNPTSYSQLWNSSDSCYSITEIPYRYLNNTDFSLPFHNGTHNCDNLLEHI